jgi:hypothetical protein
MPRRPAQITHAEVARDISAAKHIAGRAVT